MTSRGVLQLVFLERTVVLEGGVIEVQRMEKGRIGGISRLVQGYLL